MLFLAQYTFLQHDIECSGTTNLPLIKHDIICQISSLHKTTTLQKSD